MPGDEDEAFEEGESSEPAELDIPSDPEVVADSASSDRPLAFKIIHPQSDRPRRERSPRALFPLSTLAALLGLLSLALPWFYEEYSRYHEVFPIFRHIIEAGEYSTMYSVIAGLILAGSILCFITSLGATLQLTGVLLYATEVSQISGGLAVGPFVAVAAALIGMSSLVLSSRVAIPARFATFVHSENRGLSVNVLALSAFIIGLTSMFTCWFLTVDQRMDFGPTLPDTCYSQLSFLFSIRFDDLTLMIAGAALVFVGTIVCLLTPLGSLLQLAGTGLAFYELRSEYGGYNIGWVSGDIQMGAGFFMTIAAGLLGVWSMVLVKRVTIPDRFVSTLLLPETPHLFEGTSRGRVPEGPRALSRFSGFVEKIPRIARIPLTASVTLAVIVAVLAIPYALPMSRVEIWVDNSSLDSVQMDIYVDGENVGSGMASSKYQLIREVRVTSGLHTVALDYAYSSDDDPLPNGVVDWASSVQTGPYGKFQVGIVLMGRIDPTLPEVELSCASVSDGYVITFDEITSYSYYGQYLEDIQWNDIGLVVIEGLGRGASWRFSTTDLDNGSPSIYDYGTEYIGSLGLNCTAADILGNGYAGVGDYMRLMIVEGDFSESEEYVAYLMHYHYGSVIGQVTLA